MLYEIGVFESVLMCEEEVVIEPEPPLFVGTLGGHRRASGVLVHGQREVPPDEPDMIGVSGENLLQQRRRPAAERALKIGELDDFYRCGCRTGLRGVHVGCDGLSPR